MSQYVLALDHFSLDGLDAGSVSLFVIICLTLFGFLRGAVRLIFFVFTIAGSGYAAFLGHDLGMEYLSLVWEDPPLMFGGLFAFLSALVTFYILSKIFHFFVNPFENNGFIEKFVFGIPAALVSMIAACCLVIGSLLFLQYKGTESELEYWLMQDEYKEQNIAPRYPILAQISEELESSNLGHWINQIYMPYDRPHFIVAKYLVIKSNAYETSKAVYEDTLYEELLKHSDFRKLLRDESILNSIEQNDASSLLVNPVISKVARDQTIRSLIERFSDKD